jgi:hypothetical protein
MNSGRREGEKERKRAGWQYRCERAGKAPDWPGALTELRGFLEFDVDL